MKTQKKPIDSKAKPIIKDKVQVKANEEKNQIKAIPQENKLKSPTKEKNEINNNINDKKYEITTDLNIEVLF